MATGLKLDSNAGGSITFTVENGLETDEEYIIPSSGAVPLDGSIPMTGDLNIKGNYVSPFGFKNQVINSRFDIWQRGASYTGIDNGYCAADRWYLSTVNTITMSKSFNKVFNFKTDQTMLIITAATTGATQIQTRLEGLRKYSNSKQTLSYDFSSSQAGTFRAKLRANFGVGGSSSLFLGSVDVVTAGGYADEKLIRTFTIPDLSGYTFEAGSYLQIEIYMGSDTLAVADNNFYLANVQLEAGEVATPIEERPIGTETALCQRYYQIHRLQHYCYAKLTTNYIERLFPVKMRTVPAITGNGTSYGGGALGGGSGYLRLSTGTAADQNWGYVSSGIEFDAEL